MGGKLTLYFDRCCGKKFPAFIRKAQPPFEIKSHFYCNYARDMKDDQWLTIAGKNDWIVLTHDRKFHKIPSEFAAIIQHKVKCFYLPGENDQMWEKLKYFVRASNKILSIAETESAPFIFKINPSGHFSPIKIDGLGEKLHLKLRI